MYMYAYTKKRTNKTHITEAAPPVWAFFALPPNASICLCALLQGLSLESSLLVLFHKSLLQLRRLLLAEVLLMQGFPELACNGLEAAASSLRNLHHETGFVFAILQAQDVDAARLRSIDTTQLLPWLFPLSQGGCRGGCCRGGRPGLGGSSSRTFLRLALGAAVPKPAANGILLVHRAGWIDGLTSTGNPPFARLVLGPCDQVARGISGPLLHPWSGSLASSESLPSLQKRLVQVSSCCPLARARPLLRLLQCLGLPSARVWRCWAPFSRGSPHHRPPPSSPGPAPPAACHTRVKASVWHCPFWGHGPAAGCGSGAPRSSPAAAGPTPSPRNGSY